MTVAVIVPWRDRGDPLRRANLDRVEQHLAKLGWPVLLTDDGRDGPFCRSAAYNRGVKAAPGAVVYVFCEADMLVPLPQLILAATLAARAPRLVVPFDEYRYLSPEASVAVRKGRIGELEVQPQRVMAHGRSVGAVNVLSAAALRVVGRWDEGFAGWGWDDRAMTHAFTVTGGPPQFVRGPAVHLWHTPGWQAGERFAGGAEKVSRAERAATKANEARYRRYQRATTPAQIRSLTTSPHVVSASGHDARISAR